MGKPGEGSNESQLAAAALASLVPRERAFQEIARCGGVRAALARLPAGPGVLQSLRVRCERLGLSLVSFFDAEFPALLREIPDPPLALYLLGNRALLHTRAVAVVGSRRCSRGGAQFAAHLGRGLAAQGFTVVSGLALGIDAAAHRGVADLAPAALPAVAVMGCGLAEVYPRSNYGLAQTLLGGGGLLVSEYPPDMRPAKHQFPERNRLISGLCLGVVLVEASQRSGSLITARLALEQGREVLAVPGSVAGGMSRGCHRLLKQGAALVEGVDDVAEALGLQSRATEPAAIAPEELAGVLAAVSPDGSSLDEVAQRAGIAVSAAAAHLVLLELEGFVAQVPGGYIRRPSSA